MAHKLTSRVWLLCLGIGLAAGWGHSVFPKTGDTDTDTLIWMAFGGVVMAVVVVCYKVRHRWSKLPK